MEVSDREWSISGGNLDCPVIVTRELSPKTSALQRVRIESLLEVQLSMTYPVTRSLTAILGLEPNEVEALKAPIVTISELRQVKAFPLNVRALIVGIVWTGVADVGTPPLRNPQVRPVWFGLQNGCTHKACWMS
jgi:hypothetical protein